MGNEKYFKENKNGRICKQILIQLQQQLNDEIRQIENVHFAHLTTQGSPRRRTAYLEKELLLSEAKCFSPNKLILLRH